MIKITVRASWAARYMGVPALVLNIENGAAAIEAVKRAGIPHDEAGILAIRDVIIPPSALLADGDELEVFPQIIGG